MVRAVGGHPHAPLTWDDLIDFHFLLEVDELFMTLLIDAVPARVEAVNGLADLPVSRRPS